MKNLKFLIVIMFLCGTGLKSQSLDSLIAEGLKNNPGLASIQRNIESALSRGESVGYLPPPNLGIEFSQVPFKDPDIFDNAISQNLILSQMFMLGSKLSAMSEAEKKQADILRSDLDIYKLNLVESIRKTYYDIWMMEHHLGLWDSNLEFLNNIAASTEQLYQVNRTSYSDLLLLKAEIASALNEVETMENDLQSMYYMMNSLLGRENKDTEIIVKHNWQPDTSEINKNKLEEELLNNNPSLAKMNKMEEMNQLELEANSREYYPDLMIQGMVMRMPQGMLLTTKNPMPMPDEPATTEYMFSIMASVTLPFAPWSSGRIKTKEEELLSSAKGLSAEKHNMRLMLTSQFHSLVNSVESSRRKIKRLSEDVIPLYKQTIESQLTEFQNNRNTIINLIQTINMSLMKEEELAGIITEHQKKLAEIETLTAASKNKNFNGEY